MWKKIDKWFSSNLSIFFKLMGILALSIFGTWLYSYFSVGFDSLFLNDNEAKLKDAVALSNIRRNYAILFFGIFGGCLAIWARLATQKQLEYSREQIELSQQVNRNDRFAKAVEMLSQREEEEELTIHGDTTRRYIDDVMVQKAGLNMVQNLMDEKDTEYRRCIDLLGDYLRRVANKNLARIAVGIMDAEIKNNPKANNHKEMGFKNGVVNKIIEKWPDLSGAYLCDLKKLQRINLSNANLSNANLSNATLIESNLTDADLTDADLTDADLTDADLTDAKGLAVEQILSAKWYTYFGDGEPPKLPAKLLENEKIKGWLNYSSGETPTILHL